MYTRSSIIVHIRHNHPHLSSVSQSHSQSFTNGAHVGPYSSLCIMCMEGSNCHIRQKIVIISVCPTANLLDGTGWAHSALPHPDSPPPSPPPHPVTHTTVQLLPLFGGQSIFWILHIPIKVFKPIKATRALGGDRSLLISPIMPT